MTLKVFVIAGEHSGDVLGAALIKSLRAKQPDIELRGIGGPKMIEAGLPESLFSMEHLSVMGLAEILPRIPKFLSLISKTAQAIRNYNPDIVVTIDSPDFCFRVQKKLKEQGVRAKRIHYVAPTVWAWRSGRALKISTFLDGIMCLFPFEPPYFEREGLHASFVGHPMVESGILDGDGKAFRDKYNIAGDVKTLGLFCGSRKGELERAVPAMRNLLDRMRAIYPDLVAIVPTLPKWHERLEKEFADKEGVVVTSSAEEKYNAFRACDAAVLVSGTVALEVALSGVPHILFYQMNSLTWAIVRRLVKTKYAHLGNILLKRRAFHEFIQDQAKVGDMESILDALLNDPARKADARKVAREILDILRPNPNLQAGDVAAAFVLS